MSNLIDPRLEQSDGTSRLPYPAPTSMRAMDHEYKASPYSLNTAAASGPEELGSASPNNDDAKRATACVSCRSLKVRCDRDPSNLDAPCKRCTKARRECIYVEPSRKRQKKADTRVADLERKLDALTAEIKAREYAQHGLSSNDSAAAAAAAAAAVSHSSSGTQFPQSKATDSQALGRSSGGPSPPSAELPYPAYHIDMQWAKRRRTETGSEPAAPYMGNCYDGWRRPSDPHTDVTRSAEGAAALAREDEKILKMGMRQSMYPTAPEAIISFICQHAEPGLHAQLFQRFIQDCLPNMPLMEFSPGTTASEVLNSRPILFLCITAVTGYGIISPEAMLKLHDKVSEVFSDCIIRKGLKSLELVQSILIVTLWFKPPEGHEHMSFYTLIHSACCIALDIGLGKPFNRAKARRGFGGPASDLPPGRPSPMVDSDSIEGRRTWLAVYFCCAAASIALRRPNLVRWSNYMQQCVEYMESAPGVSALDRYFLEIVKLQKISDDIAVSFQMDDPTATAISITDPKVSYTLDIHEQKVKDWRKNLPAELADSSKLMFFYDATLLYLNEIAMHVNHNVEDFKLPFTEQALSDVTKQSEALTQRQMAALEACLRSAHRIIAAYCSFGFDVAGTMPTILFFVRCVYGIVVLIKMHMAVTAPGSEVAKVIKKSDVRVLEHMDMLWCQFQGVSKYASHRPHGKMLMILSVLREWLIQNVEGVGNKETKAPTKEPPFGRNPHGSDSKLQVLSEAATASSTGRSPQVGLARDHTGGGYPQSQSWALDMSDLGRRTGRSISSVASETTPSASVSTPQMPNILPDAQVDAAAAQKKRGTYGDAFTGFWDTNLTPANADWTAGLDLDQILDGAFRDIDTSGDLGGFFFGDGAGAYAIPNEGAAPQQPGADGRW